MTSIRHPAVHSGRVEVADASWTDNVAGGLMARLLSSASSDETSTVGSVRHSRDEAVGEVARGDKLDLVVLRLRGSGVLVKERAPVAVPYEQQTETDQHDI